MQPEFQLFETILWRPGSGYWLLDEHLQRLVRSARYFRFSCELSGICSRLRLEEAALPGGCHRVRLVLAKDGRLSLSAVPCAAPALTRLPPRPAEEYPSGDAVIDFSSGRVDDESPLLFHKTTLRGLYDTEYERARKAGLVDCIFSNSAGEVTEGCITNIVIYRNGSYLTPPVASGLLPGVMREHLLADAAVAVVEKVLTRQEVSSAEAIYVCNSVRGLIRVTMKPAQ
jgi:para-aminobenzoate synthetase/4-amino-4-deoxychorismate lyase